MSWRAQTIRNDKNVVKKADRNRMNDEITAREVRLIDAEGEQLGIVKLAVAQSKAEEAQ